MLAILIKAVGEANAEGVNATHGGIWNNIRTA